MTLEQYRENLTRLAQEITRRVTDAAVVPAGSLLTARIKNRIINDGLNSNGAKIGSYSTRPSYYTRDKFIKKSVFKGVGQRGFTGERIVSTKQYRAVKQKNGRERLVSEKKFKVVKKTPKSMYLEGGYAELRRIQGRESAFVNLEYSGDTLLALQLVRNGQTVQIGFIKQKAALLRKVLESRYGKVFSATNDEVEEYSKEVDEITIDLTRRILSGL